MYRDPYRDDYDRDTSRSYSRDPYYDERPRERSSYEDRDRDRLRSYPPPPPPSILDDPYLRRLEELEARSISRSLREPPPEPGAVSLGSVVIIPPSPFDPRPKKREKPLNCDTVFIGSLPDNCTEKHLEEVFSNCGQIAEVRISRGRNFGHVQFSMIDDSVDKAVELSSCRIRVGPSNSMADVSKIHVDYAQPRSEIDIQKRIRDCAMMSFSSQNVTTISSDLHHDEAFRFGAKNIIYWIERGNCTQANSNTFFGLVSSANTHCRKLSKNLKAKQLELAEAQSKHMENLENLEKDCAVLEEVFVTTSQQKAWDTFTKPQRKTLSMWKDFAAEFHSSVQKALEGGGEPTSDGEAPATKKIKVEPDTVAEADLERCQKEVNQLKVDHEVAMEKKDRQILQLKTLLARFKQACPEEWEKAIGTPAKPKEEKKKATSVAKGRGRRGKKVQPLPPGDEGEEEEKMEEEVPKEVIEGVGVDDLNEALEKVGENSLAAAAAAYAQARSAIGSTEAAGLNLTELEVAVVSVIATFLTVHPLGAAIEEVSSYLHTFNPTLTSIYVEALIRRLPQVFQLSQSAEGKPKWWFSGFNSCCNQAQYGAGTSAGEEPVATVKSPGKQ